MSLPSYSDLKLWVGTLFTRQDWDYNFKKIVDWLSDGSSDLVVGTVKASNGINLDGGRITNIAPAQTGSEAINLDQAQTLLNRTSYYYLSSVASGKENETGDSDFLQKDSDVQVTILAGGVNPDLVICQSDGTVESLTSNTVLTIGSANATYYIIKEKGENPVITNSKYSIGKVLPTSDISAGDYFLDNSTIPFKAYKYDPVSGWVDTPFCLLGIVEKVNGTATCTPEKYNDNKFDLNIYSKEGLVVGYPDFITEVSKSVNTTYTADTDGWLYVYCMLPNRFDSTFNYVSLTIDSKEAWYAGFRHNSGESREEIKSGGLIPIAKGQTYKATKSGDGSSTLNFYSCKGV